MEGKKFALDDFHKCQMVVVELRLSPLEVSVVGQLSEIDIVPGEAFPVDQSMGKLLGLINYLDLGGQLGDFLLHGIFLNDELLEFGLHQKNYKLLSIA
jgi:hypothetical protein